MQIINFNELDEKQKQEVLKRPAIAAKDEISQIVSSIIKEVREKGDEALIEQTLNLTKPKFQALK